MGVAQKNCCPWSIIFHLHGAQWYWAFWDWENQSQWQICFYGAKSLPGFIYCHFVHVDWIILHLLFHKTAPKHKITAALNFDGVFEISKINLSLILFMPIAYFIYLSYCNHLHSKKALVTLDLWTPGFPLDIQTTILNIYFLILE